MKPRQYSVLTLDSLNKLLDGKKTYIAAVGYFCLGIYQTFNNQQELASQSFLNAFAFFGIRSAMTKSEKKITQEVQTTKLS